MDDYQRLEQQFARWNDLDPAGMVACSSGTAALLLALQGLDISQRSVVVMPDYTMVACARAVTVAGMYPVFLDSLPVVLTIDPDEVRTACKTEGVTPSAVMAVHVYGRRCFMDRLGRICDKLGPHLIEDMAESHGLPVHSSTSAACWSFYRNKIIAGEEGGAVWFRDNEAADRARTLRSMGFTKAHDYTHVPGGWNHRMSNAHARMILDSLHNVDENIRQRWEQWHIYAEAVPTHFQGPEPDAPWVFDVQIKGMTRDRQVEAVGILQKAGAPVRYGFRPMLTQVEYAIDDVHPNENPVAYTSMTEVIYMNLVPGTDVGQVRQWADLLARVATYSGK